MKNFLEEIKQKSLFLSFVLSIIAIYFISLFMAESRLASLQNNFELNINNEFKNLITLSEMIARGEANDVANKVMPDCSLSERVIFDNRLGKLNEGLNQKELKELDNLFGRCAATETVRRSSMVSQFETYVKSFTSLIEQRKLLGEYANYDQSIISLSNLLLAEKTITNLSFDLVNLQNEIIKQLIAGVAIDSAVASELKERGQVIRTELTVEVNKAKILRESLK